MKKTIDSTDSVLSETALDDLIGALQVARRVGFSLESNDATSQAFTPLVEALIDLNLRIAHLLEQNTLRRYPSISPELEFDEFSQDELGNPRQIKHFFDNPVIEDGPALAQFYRDSAAIQVDILHHGFIPSSFMEEVYRTIGMEVPSVPESWQTTSPEPDTLHYSRKQSKAQKCSKKSQSRSGYSQRRNRRRKGNHAH
jgi:hypothetical protein